MQDAVPIRLGQEFAAYSRVIDRDIKRIRQTREDLYEVNMGATAVGIRIECGSYIIFCQHVTHIC